MYNNKNDIIGWTDDTPSGILDKPSGKGQRLIVCHAGTVNGFISDGLLLFTSKKTGDYHEEMDSARFKEWFLNALLPNIPPQSTIIMDNAPYHSVVLNKAPTSSWRKNEIILWLRKNGVPCSEDLLKAELLGLVRLNKPRYQTYEIDELAKANGKSSKITLLL